MVDNTSVVEVRDPGKTERERNPEVEAKPKRRRFTAKYKLQVLEKVDRLKDQPGELGQFLRREGLYASYITAWRREKQRGALKALGKKRGRPADPDAKLVSELEQLKATNARLEFRLKRAEAIIDLQKKALTLFDPTETNERL